MRRAWFVYAALVLILGAGIGMSVWIYQTRNTGPWKARAPNWDTYLTRVTTAERVGGDSADRFPAPSASRTGQIPRERMGDSAMCGQAGCHPDITKQWEQSMHHLASFNNIFYKKSVEYARERQGAGGVRWCAGCHDPVLLFAGEIDGPVTDKTPYADAGVTCMTCHAMVDVQDLTGNGRYVLDVPNVDFLRPDHPLRGIVGILLKIFPRPHKHGFLKPLHTQSEFCSACHRVSIGVAQNRYRWIRGQDQFGSWQNGGASGRVARAFYTPKESKQCQDCHMPSVPSTDAGNRGGMVHSHTFPGANAAVPAVLGYPGQAALSKAFLTGSMRVDIVGAREVPPGDNLKDTRWLTPIEKSRLTPGSDVRLDVVVRNLRVGHSFPEGTVDNKDIWLDVSVKDDKGRPISQDQCPPVVGDLPRSAHIYGATLLDAAGQRINKRNINDYRNTLFRRLIGTGQSDVVHYRFRVPPKSDAKDAPVSLTFEATLRYRKVRKDYAQWTYAGHRKAGVTPPPVGSPVDTTPFEIDPSIPVPDIMVVDVATDRVTVALGDSPILPEQPRAAALPERLYDYGVAFFLHQDFPESREVFGRLIKEAPESPSGYFGLARSALSQGNDEDAVTALNQVVAILKKGQVKDPGAPARLQALMAQAMLNRGDYAGALRLFQEVLRTHPDDRSVYVDLGFTYFQMENYPAAVAEYQKALALDPDDLGAHSTLARIYQVMGKTEEAKREQRTFEALREDVSLDGTREKYLETHPDEAKEIVSGHEHRLDGTCAP